MVPTSEKPWLSPLLHSLLLTVNTSFPFPVLVLQMSSGGRIFINQNYLLLLSRMQHNITMETQTPWIRVNSQGCWLSAACSLWSYPAIVTIEKKLSITLLSSYKSRWFWGKLNFLDYGTGYAQNPNLISFMQKWIWNAFLSICTEALPESGKSGEGYL